MERCVVCVHCLHALANAHENPFGIAAIYWILIQNKDGGGNMGHARSILPTRMCTQIITCTLRTRQHTQTHSGGITTA
jgi:hypothetical protein